MKKFFTAAKWALAVLLAMITMVLLFGMPDENLDFQSYFAVLMLSKAAGVVMLVLLVCYCNNISTINNTINKILSYGN